jgi:hypothetical protein
MERKTPKWEAELWSYLNSGDGINCPLYSSCQLRGDNDCCFSGNEIRCDLIKEYVDKDGIDLDLLERIKPELPACPSSARIFKLVKNLAYRYLEEAEINQPPVPSNLITHAYGGIPIEVRQLPLKAYRGAVWRLNNCWVIQLNSNDTTARQRFTLYHEIFHVLAHSKATPVFRKATHQREGTFNEILADDFSAACLVPEKLVKKIWPKIKDINQMATIFDVPKTIILFKLKLLGLI